MELAISHPRVGTTEQVIVSDRGAFKAIVELPQKTLETIKLFCQEEGSRITDRLVDLANPPPLKDRIYTEPMTIRRQMRIVKKNPPAGTAGGYDAVQVVVWDHGAYQAIVELPIRALDHVLELARHEGTDPRNILIRQAQPYPKRRYLPSSMVSKCAMSESLHLQ